MTIEEINNLFQQAKGRKKQIDFDLLDKQKKLDNLQKKLILMEKAQSFLQKVAQDTQSQLKFQVEDIVNIALDTCFPDEYIFKLNFVISRGKTEAQLVFLSQKTKHEIDPMNASGGGVVDLVSFALRIALFVLEQNVNNVIVLDEPFRFVSKDLLHRVKDILRMLSDKLKLQFIIVTHIADIADVADRIFEVKKVGNVSKVRKWN